MLRDATPMCGSMVVVIEASVAEARRTVDVPVQFFQSVIAVELAITGALLFQVRFFDRPGSDGAPLPDPRLRLLMVLVLTGTVFGALEATRDGGGETAAALLTAGVALSLVPILLRVLPPIRSGTRSREHDPQLWVTVLGLALYAGLVALLVLAT
jgi:hypothetical protein